MRSFQRLEDRLDDGEVEPDAVRDLHSRAVRIEVKQLEDQLHHQLLAQPMLVESRRSVKVGLSRVHSDRRLIHQFNCHYSPLPAFAALACFARSAASARLGRAPYAESKAAAAPLKSRWAKR